MTKAIANCSKL